MRLASGIVKEPMIGTKTVSRVIVSMFMIGVRVHAFLQEGNPAKRLGNPTMRRK
jgi:hypothetical protein